MPDYHISGRDSLAAYSFDQVSEQRVEDLVTLARYKMMGRAQKTARPPAACSTETPRCCNHRDIHVDPHAAFVHASNCVADVVPANRQLMPSWFRGTIEVMKTAVRVVCSACSLVTAVCLHCRVSCVVPRSMLQSAVVVPESEAMASSGESPSEQRAHLQVTLPHHHSLPPPDSSCRCDCAQL